MLTIVYITCRLEPRLDLFFDSLAPQLKSTDQVVLVDHWTYTSILQPKELCGGKQGNVNQSIQLTSTDSQLNYYD